MVEKIIELAKENLSIDGEITATSSFKEDLEVDSLDHNGISYGIRR